MSEYPAGPRPINENKMTTKGTLFDGYEEPLGLERTTPPSHTDELGRAATWWTFSQRDDMSRPSSDSSTYAYPCESFVTFGDTGSDEVDDSDETEPYYPEDRYQRWYEQDERHVALLSIEERLRRLEKARDESPAVDTAYSELGGAVDFDVRYQLLSSYKPWMRDIQIAVEEYGLFDMTAADVEHMTVKDRDILALYVDGFHDKLLSTKMLIRTFRSDVVGQPYMDRYKTKGYRPTSSELVSYQTQLYQLETVLSLQGACKKLVECAHDKQPFKDRRQKTRRKNERDKKDMPRVYFDAKQEKYRVELIATN